MVEKVRDRDLLILGREGQKKVIEARARQPPSAEVGCSLPQCIEDLPLVRILEYIKEVRIVNKARGSRCKDAVVWTRDTGCRCNVNPAREEVHVIHYKIAGLDNLILRIVHRQLTVIARNIFYSDALLRH